MGLPSGTHLGNSLSGDVVEVLTAEGADLRCQRWFDHLRLGQPVDRVVPVAQPIGQRSLRFGNGIQEVECQVLADKIGGGLSSFMSFSPSNRFDSIINEKQ